MAKYKDKTDFLSAVKEAGLRLNSNTPIVCQREDGSFYLDCSGMFPADRKADVQNFTTIAFAGAHSKKPVAKDGKTKLYLNLLGQTIPENEIANDIEGSILYQLVSEEHELPLPTSDIQVVTLKRQLLSNDDSVYEEMITKMFPKMAEISTSTDLKEYLSQFSVSVNPDNTLNVETTIADPSKFKLLLSSMRTQMRTASAVYQQKIAHHFNNMEFAVVCRKMNLAVVSVVEKFVSRTLESTKTEEKTSFDKLQELAAERHKENVASNQVSVGTVVAHEAQTRSEKSARETDNKTLNDFLDDRRKFFTGDLQNYVKKHNQKIEDWNFAKEQLEEFLKSPEATPFFTEVPGKTFNGQELAEGLLAFLKSKFKGPDRPLPDAEFGALFVKCYSLMTKETSPKELLKHKPIQKNAEITAFIEAAKNAETPAPEPGA